MPTTDKLPHVDILEHGAHRDGDPQTLDRRLYMQLLVFDVAQKHRENRLRGLATALKTALVSFVLYREVQSPAGIGLLTWRDDPSWFTEKIPSVLASLDFELQVRRDFSMFGRTYSSGYEPDLQHALFLRPIGNVTNPEHEWHVWYPLRRFGEFYQLPDDEQKAILREHSTIGMSFGQRNFAHDIRLASHGLDTNDNDFVIGLVAKELHAISVLVSLMRKTKQTSQFVQQMGPFFVGHVCESWNGSESRS
jgi:chlorite dismutase